jgi:hypothetical protein
VAADATVEAPPFARASTTPACPGTHAARLVVIVTVVTSMVAAATPASSARMCLPLSLGEQQLLAAPTLGRRLVLDIRILCDLQLPDELVQRHGVEVTMDLDRDCNLLQPSWHGTQHLPHHTGVIQHLSEVAQARGQAVDPHRNSAIVSPSPKIRSLNSFIIL